MKPLEKLEAALRDHGLSLPETTEEFPWGHRALKVKGKSFAFLVQHPKELDVSIKLPFAAPAALSLPFAKPTEYGMGKSGWVTLMIPDAKAIELPVLIDWLNESYRAVAPKRVVAQMEAALTAPSEKAAAKSPAKKAGTATKSAARKAPAKKK